MDLSAIFLALAGLFFAGLLADHVGRTTRLPRVTMLLGCGIAAGGAGLDLIPETVAAWFDVLSIVALTMVAFLLGGSLTRDTLRAHGAVIVTISLAIVLATLATVAAGLWLAGLPLVPALLLAAIATATAPAATTDVILQSGVDNGFTRTLEGIVAIDDVWGLVVFSLVLAVIAGDGLGEAGGAALLLGAVREIFGALLLGLAIGVPAAVLTGRLSPGEPLQTEALGIVFLVAGASIGLEVSYLICAMTVGAVVANLATHHTRAFDEIEHIRWPFMLLFFVLAGALLEPAALYEVGLIGLLYVALRAGARIAGGWLGATLAGAPRPERPWYGVALMPQAGVAVGMALIASEAVPEWADAILALTIGTTVLFELVGPLGTQLAISRMAQRP